MTAVTAVTALPTGADVGLAMVGPCAPCLTSALLRSSSGAGFGEARAGGGWGGAHELEAGVGEQLGQLGLGALPPARHHQHVKTLFGRIRPIPDINGKNVNLRGFAERTAVNTPLQGTAADLIKLAMIRIDEAIRDRNLKSRMTLQVHDELVFEVPEAELDVMRSLVREYMEKVHPLTVPLVVEIGVGRNWRDLE